MTWWANTKYYLPADDGAGSYSNADYAGGRSTSGGISSTDYKFGSHSFGPSNAVNVPDSDDFDYQNDWCFEAWVKPVAISEYTGQCIFYHGGASVYVAAGVYRIGTPGTYYLRIEVRNGAFWEQRDHAALGYGNWVHMRLAYDASASTIYSYIGGSRQSNTTFAPANMPTTAQLTGNVLIGTTGPWSQWSGNIDDVRFINNQYDYSVSPAEDLFASSFTPPTSAYRSRAAFSSAPRSGGVIII